MISNEILSGPDPFIYWLLQNRLFWQPTILGAQTTTAEINIIRKLHATISKSCGRTFLSIAMHR